MNWIDKVFPIITLILGWGISEFGKFSTERKSNGKKFKKLLFNLLELRWLLKRELDVDKDIVKCIERLKLRFGEEFGVDAAKDAENIRPIIIERLKKQIINPDRIKEIETNIDYTIIELAEIYPIFAYELSGQYKIKERLESVSNYYSEFINELTTELTEWIQPKLSGELIEELDNYIIQIASKINRKTKKEVLLKISVNDAEDNNEIDEFIEAYIEKIKAMNNM